MSTPDKLKTEMIKELGEQLAKAFEQIKGKLEVFKSTEITLSFPLYAHRPLTLEESMHYDDLAANVINEVMSVVTKPHGISVIAVAVNSEQHLAAIVIKRGELEHDSSESEEINANGKNTDEG